jgi:hypothetical protein
VTTTTYTDLDHNRSQIRLLTIQGGKAEDDIVGHLHTVSLDDGLDYEALSYTWGDLNNTAFIQLNDIKFKVTSNPKSALQSLRHPNPVRVLWVDAVSINQANIEERANQVRKMGRIYIQARGVVAWLGPSSLASESTIDAMELLGRDPRLHWTDTREIDCVGNHSKGWSMDTFSDELDRLLNCAW